MTRARLAELLIEGPDETPKEFLARHRNGDGAPDRGEDGADAAGGEAQKEKPKIDKKITVFLNRLLLRLHSVPSLMTYLADVTVFQDDEAKDGQCKIQLDFLRLPEEVFPQLARLCAAPRQPKLVRYVKNGSARTGVELVVKPDDFAGEDYDYSYC